MNDSIPAPRRNVTMSRNKALVAGVICWSGFAVMAWLVATGRTARFDEIGLLAARREGSFGLAGPAMLLEGVRDVTALGGVLLRSVFALAAAVALSFIGMRREAGLFVMTVLTGWAVNSQLKYLVGRERPQIVPHLTEAGGPSFPSGHSFNAAVVYIAMALLFASMSQRRSVRYTLVASAMALSAMVAWSRVMLGVHFPSDVIAGWLGGAGWAFLAAALLYKPAKAAADSEVADSLDLTMHTHPPHSRSP